MVQERLQPDNVLLAVTICVTVSVCDTRVQTQGVGQVLRVILSGRARISPEMAVRLSMAFGTSAESWLNLKTQYDLWHAERRRKQLRVAKLASA
jgi:addiction module HigA family antidote